MIYFARIGLYMVSFLYPIFFYKAFTLQYFTLCDLIMWAYKILAYGIMLNEYFSKQTRTEAYDLIQNDTELALNIFNELLEQEPENIEVLNGKGSALMKLNKIDEADECFNQSILVSENPSALINKGLISKQRNEYSKALKYYDSAIQLDSNLNNIVSILKNEIMDLIDDNILSTDEFAPEANECIKAGIDFQE